MKAWALLSNDKDRSWQGNDGYSDVLGSQYVYDSKVGNHLNVKEGDLVVLRDRQEVFGISRIERIDSEPATKTQSVCPQCGLTDITFRKTKTPTYLCRSCRNEFDEPITQDVPVTRYVAQYGTQWEPLDGALTYADIEPALDGAKQSSIRTCDISRLEGRLVDVSALIPDAPRRPPDHAVGQVPKGGRRSAVVSVRNGQDAFRKQLLRLYGLSCAVTGPCPVPVLQAAHLRKFADHESHDPAQGILLRTDLHQLFDAEMMAVDPITMTVVIKPILEHYPVYRELMGAPVAPGIYDDALAEHFGRVGAASWNPPAEPRP